MSTDVGTVIQGTMLTRDLLPAFLDELEHRDPVAFAEIGKIPKEAFFPDGAWWSASPWWDSDDAHYLLEELFDALDACSPEGYYFGACPGDGSDYGFWPVEEE